MESILQVLKSNPRARILACAPSNDAADLIAQKLTSLGNQQLFRLYAPSRIPKFIPDNLRDFVYQDQDGCFSVKGAHMLSQYRVVVSTCGSSSIPHGIGMAVGHFSHIFIDEAGQAMEPEVSCPILSRTSIARTNVYDFLDHDLDQDHGGSEHQCHSFRRSEAARTYHPFGNREPLRSRDKLLKPLARESHLLGSQCSRNHVRPYVAYALTALTSVSIAWSS